jgi:hypothetical protein
MKLASTIRRPNGLDTAFPDPLRDADSQMPVDIFNSAVI